MEEFTYKDLQKLRKSRDMTQWQLAAAAGVSEDTVGLWERGKQKPDPDDVDRIEEALGVAGLWHRWMYSNCDSYRKRYRNVDVSSDLLWATISTQKELEDVLQLIPEIIHSLLTGEKGKIDDSLLKERAKNELDEAIASMTAKRALLDD